LRFAETLRSAAGRAYWASPHFLSHVAGKVVILMYHRVLPASDIAATYVQPGMYVTPETFEQHLAFVSTHLHPLTFAELLSRWDEGGWNDASRYCVVTFDDGWIDNYRYAFPLLRKYGVPATIFLATGYIGSDEWLWSDRLGDLLRRRRQGTPAQWNRAIERAKDLPDRERDALLCSLAMDADDTQDPGRRFLDWNEIREMARHGVAFGSHTSSHANLSRLSGAALERELREPLERLRTNGIPHVPVLAYPNGDHTDAVVQAARAAGYSAAVSVRAGLESKFPSDRFRLRRINVHEDVSRSAPALALHIGRQSLTARSH
jgi:peptidoglycan/xylan/chitin deacetylase (PgdA/CDA1 family)